MKKIFFGIILFQISTISFNSIAQTPVNGSITSNTTWDLVNSPYEVTGNVTVEAGVTLTLEPGVTVSFTNNNFDLTIEGTLIADGTPADSIYFQNSLATIFITSTSTGSIIDHARFDNMGVFNIAALHVSSSTNISHSKFVDCEVGITVAAGASPSIQNCTIISSNDYGIRIDNGSPSISDVVIDGDKDVHSSSGGIWIQNGSPNISTSTFSNIGNNGGIWVNTTDVPIIDNNTFSNNTRDVRTHPLLLNDANYDNNGLSQIHVDPVNITQNTTWHKPQLPEDWVYVKLGGNTIDAGATLTIEPGLTIESINYTHDIIVNGTLIAEGTDTDSITFIGSEIHLEASSIGSSFDYVIFEGMGAFNQAALQLYTDDVSIQNGNFKTCEVGISVHNDVAPIISNNRFFDSNDYGLRIYGGSPVVENNVIDGQSGSVGGIIIEGGKPTIRNNEISNIAQNQTSYGIIIGHDAEAPVLENNTLSNNSREILTHPHLVNDTIFDTNGFSEIYIDNKSITQNTTWHKSQLPEDWSYVKVGGNTIDAGVTLTVEPGVTIESTNYTHDIIVNGTLIAEGTTTDSIVFIGSEIHLEASSTGSSFDYVIFEGMGAFNQAGLQLYTTNATIDHSLFDDCEVGISVHNGVSPDVSNALFRNSNDYGIRVYDGSPTISNSSFDGNPFAILNEGSGIVNAIDNWWGDNSGPLNATANPAGLGEEVSDGVDFDPWLEFDPFNSVISIATHPVDQTACDSDPITFNVATSGANNLQYQWQEDKGDGFVDLTNSTGISGATTATLQLSSVTISMDANQYQCVISGDNAVDVISQVAQLNVSAGPDIVSQPTNQTVDEGQNVNFSVTASGDDLSYQWQKDGEDISGATSSTLSLSLVGPSDAGAYQCNVLNGCGAVTSSTVSLTVNDPSNPLNVSGTVDQLLIYPNPAAGYFTVRLPNGGGDSYSVRLSDLSGKQVFYRSIKSLENEVLIEATGMVRGTYLVNVLSGSKLVATSTVIIQ